MDYITEEEVLEWANILYADAKTKQCGFSQEDTKYWAPEQFPQIESEQVKCLAKSLVKFINRELERFYTDNR